MTLDHDQRSTTPIEQPQLVDENVYEDHAIGQSANPAVESAHAKTAGNRKTGLIAAGAAAVGALAAVGGMLVMKGGDEQESLAHTEQSSVVTDSSPSPVEETTARILTPIDRPNVEEESAPEAESPAAPPETTVPTETEQYSPWKPELITAEDPAGIIRQYEHNYNCALNAPTLEEQLECVKYQLGSTDGTGSLSTNLLGVVYEINNYRLSHPDFTLTVSVDLLDSRFEGPDDNTLVAIVTETDQDIGETYYRRIRLERKSANIEDLSLDGASQPVWLVQNVETIEPGDISFD